MKAVFTAILKKVPHKGGWTYVQWPESVEFFGTKGLVKIEGTIDKRAFKGSFMAMGGGKHMLPIKAEVRTLIAKKVGEKVTIQIKKRIK